MITFRELPADEWKRLDGHPALNGAAVPTPDYARCLVGEDATGTIRAVWWVMTLPFLEGAWIDESLGSLSKIALKGWLEMKRQILDTCHLRGVYCFAPTPEIAESLDKLGFTPFNVLTFVKSLTCPSLPPLPSPPSSQAGPESPALS